MAAGYSKKSLVEKLGIKAESRILILNAPQNYSGLLGKLPPNSIVLNKLEGPLDFIHFFTKERKEMENIFPKLKEVILPSGMIWVSWPKGSSKVKTDLNENVVREIGLDNNLVDVKVCAIDDTWSGLKFVHRLNDRKK